MARAIIVIKYQLIMEDEGLCYFRVQTLPSSPDRTVELVEEAFSLQQFIQSFGVTGFLQNQTHF